MLEILGAAGVFVLLVYFSLFLKNPVSDLEKTKLIDKASSSPEAQEYIRQLFQKPKHSAIQMWFADYRVEDMAKRYQQRIENEKNKQVVDEFMK